MRDQFVPHWSASLLLCRQVALLIIGLLAIANPALAAQLTLSWSSVAGAAGYKIYYGQATRNYTANVNAGNQTTYTVTGLTAGKTYYFAATAYNASGAESGFSAEAAGAVPASTAPTASFSATATSGPAPLAVTFTDTSTGTISSRSWDLGNGTTASGTTVSTNYSNPGTYNVVLTVTGSGGSSTATRTITATASNTAPLAAFSATPTSGVAPVTVQFSDASQGTVTSWSWNFGDGTASTLQNPSHSYTTPGTYNVSLSAIGPGGTNQASKTGYITVTAPGTVGGGGGGGSTKVAGLVAFYSFEEPGGTSVVDSSGNGNSGIMNTGVSRIAQGRFGQALSFNGTDGWVTVNDSASLDPTAGVTVDAWIFPTSAMSGWHTVVMKEQPGGAAYYLEANSDTDQPASAVSVGGEQILRGVNQVPVNQWTRLTATYDGQNQRIYVNGVQVAVRAQTGALATSTGALRIGGNSIWGEHFRGYIDEVRVFNRALTQAEIGGTTSNPGLVAAYGFEESSGTTVLDTSGSGNTGVISGAGRITAGRFGKALQFNGTSAWVTVNDSASLDLTTGMTLEAWVYPTARLNGWQSLINKEMGTTNAAYMLYANDANNRPQLSASIDGYPAAAGTAQLGTNAWSHVAGTYDGANFRLYINGTLAATQPQTGPIQVSGGALRIGGNAVWGEYFTGYIDEVRMYNRALTQPQIAADAALPVVP